MRRFILLAICIALLTSGCTQAQIERAEAQLAQADRAIALAQAAVDQGAKLAAQLGDVRSEQIVAQARAGLAAAVAARDTASAAVAGAKAAQAAGGSTYDVLAAVVGTLVPALGTVMVFAKNAWKWKQSMTQTVAGIETAKGSMTPDQIESLHGALAESQDEHVKAAVTLLKKTL